MNDLIKEAERLKREKYWLNWPHIHAVLQEYSGAARRPALAIEAIDAAIYRVTEEYRVITIRQLFYQLVSRGVVDKTEAEYKNTVVRRAGILRKQGLIPYSKFSDATRWMRKPKTYTGLERMLDNTAKLYRRDLWDKQDAYVEIWCEKDALAGVLVEVTDEYDVPLMVSRGYASLSYLSSAAGAINRANQSGKHAYLYHFGDYDPSGQDIPRAIEDQLADMVDDPDEFTFKMEAVKPLQVELWNLPTRPTKKTDSRSKKFRGESVELDAIPPNDLQDLVRNVIEQHIDQAVLAETRKVEQLEQETLTKIASAYQHGNLSV